MAPLNIAESHRYLLQADVAVLATIAPDGRPQVTPVWFLYDDGAIKLSLNTNRQKVKNLRANPAVTFFVLDRAAPTRYLEIRGDAELAEDLDYSFAEKVGHKYDVDLRGFDGGNAHRVVVTIRPVRVNAVDMLAGGE